MLLSQMRPVAEGLPYIQGVTQETLLRPHHAFTKPQNPTQMNIATNRLYQPRGQFIKKHGPKNNLGQKKILEEENKFVNIL